MQHFNGCNELVSIDGNINLEICYSANDMFAECFKLEYSPVTNYSGLSDIGGMYRNCQSLKELNLVTLKYNQVYNSEEFLDGVPDDCHIIVLDENMQQWLLGLYPNLTNIELAPTYTITINSDTINKDLNEGVAGIDYKLIPVSASKEIQSFDLNGMTITGDTFTMPSTDVVIDNVVFVRGYTITINSEDIVKNLDEGYPNKTYTLIPVDVNNIILSFDMITSTQGTVHIEGNSFEMVAENVILDNFEFMTVYASYESPHPYSDDMEITHFDDYVDGATYLRLMGKCNTEAGCDILNITYHEDNGEGIFDNSLQYSGDASFDVILPLDNYVKIEFYSDGSVSADYWGYRISIIRLDENYEPID